MKSIQVISAFLLASLMLAVTGCKKQETPAPPKNNLDIGELITNYIIGREKPKDGIITITARSVFSIKGDHHDPDILIDARFYEDRDEKKPFFAGDLTIGDLKIPYYNNTDASFSGYCLQSVVSLSPADRASLLALFGKKVRIKLAAAETGNRTVINSTFPTLVKTNFIDENGLYIPQNMDLQSPMFSDGNYSITTNGNATVTWTPDPNNPSGTIFIGILRERTTDINNPVPGEVVLFKEVPDNGSYTLTAGDTEALPSGSVASVFVARGSYFTYTDPVTAREVFIEAITYNVVPYAGVNNPPYQQ
jgi:hypothetical protein